MGITLDPVAGKTADGEPVRALEVPDDRLWRFHLPDGEAPDAAFISAAAAFAFMALACLKFEADVLQPAKRS